MVGGDLGYRLQKRNGYFDEKEVKFYAARTLLGLKAMHDLNIVYRGGPTLALLSDTYRYYTIPFIFISIIDHYHCYCIITKQT